MTFIIQREIARANAAIGVPAGSTTCAFCGADIAEDEGVCRSCRDQSEREEREVQPEKDEE